MKDRRGLGFERREEGNDGTDAASACGGSRPGPVQTGLGLSINVSMGTKSKLITRPSEDWKDCPRSGSATHESIRTSSPLAGSKAALHPYTHVDKTWN